MAHSAAGKSDRKGITVIELGDMFPDEKAARDLVRGTDLAGRSPLPALRQRSDA